MIESSMNQLGNATNPHQGHTKKVLCVCSAGLLRSPTIAKYLTIHKGYNTRACGTAEEYALVPLSEALLYWCDEVHVVKEQEQVVLDAIEIFKAKYNSKLKPKVVVLDIPDRYATFDPELERIIKEFYEGL